MKRVLVGAVAGLMALGGGMFPAEAAGKTDTKTTVVTNGVAIVEAKGSNAAVSGPGVAKLRKNGETIRRKSITFDKNDLGEGGGISYFDGLKKDVNGNCSLLVKYLGNSKFNASKDTISVVCKTGMTAG